MGKMVLGTDSNKSVRDTVTKMPAIETVVKTEVITERVEIPVITKPDSAPIISDVDYPPVTLDLDRSSIDGLDVILAELDSKIDANTDMLNRAIQDIEASLTRLCNDNLNIIKNIEATRNISTDILNRYQKQKRQIKTLEVTNSIQNDKIKFLHNAIARQATVSAILGTGLLIILGLSIFY